MSAAAVRQSLLTTSIESLRRALYSFPAVTVRPSFNEKQIVVELNEDADDDDRTCAYALSRTGWDSWPVIVAGPGANGDLGRRRWG